MKQMLRCAAALALAVSSWIAPVQAKPAGFPLKPVRIILPFAPGGATDVIARTLAQKLSETWGQAVLVDNRAGGNGNIGAAAAARAPADGYTLLMATSSHAINATLYKKLDYSLNSDFAAIAAIATVPLVLVANPAVPVKSPRELVSYAAAHDGALNFGSGGVGTAAHLAGEMFNTSAGTHMVHVAYKGGAPAMNDLMGGQIQLMFANLPEALPFVKAGKLHALAITGSARQPQLPDVPTFAEAGFEDMAVKSWFGLFAPKDTPKPITEQLAADVANALLDPQVQARLKTIGADPATERPETFQAFVGSEIQRWGAVVKRSGATAE